MNKALMLLGIGLSIYGLCANAAIIILFFVITGAILMYCGACMSK